MQEILNFITARLSGLNFSMVLSVLAVGYALAGIVLIINLHRNGFFKGNILGMAASVIFLTTALTLFAATFLPGDNMVPQTVIGGVAFIAIYGFIILSFKNRFVIGGYKALAVARRQLQQHERWMQIMQEHMTDGLAVFSVSGELLYINPAALALLKLDESAIRDGTNMMFGRGNKSTEEIERIKKEVLEKKEVVAKIITSKDENQSAVVEVKLAPVYSKLGRVIALTVSYRDITESYELERAKEEFIQIASHELRTPLTAVKGFLELLQSKRYGVLPNKQKELVLKALAAGEHLSKLVDNLLVVARIEESRLSYNPEMVDVESVINTVAQELTGEADRCGISLRVLPSSKKLSKINADKEKLQQIITNLAGNAIKYTGEGGHVFIEAKESGGKVEIAVTDTGIGIAKNDLKKLFRKFERIMNRQSVRVGGSGLGLVIVKSFTELHGGEVKVLSTEGKGSTFTISLPLNAANNYASHQQIK